MKMPIKKRLDFKILDILEILSVFFLHDTIYLFHKCKIK